MATPSNSTKFAVLKLLSSGQITFSEAARQCGESTQLIMYWAKAAGIDMKKARQARVDELWQQALAEIDVQTALDNTKYVTITVGDEKYLALHCGNQ